MQLLVNRVRCQESNLPSELDVDILMLNGQLKVSTYLSRANRSAEGVVKAANYGREYGIKKRKTQLMLNGKKSRSLH